jgi:lipid A 4'-phosphatase
MTDIFEEPAGTAFRRVRPSRSQRTSWTFRSRWPIVWPLTLLAGLTALFRWTALDLWISQLFFDHQHRIWPWFNSAPCMAFYHLAIYPPLILAACGGVMAAAGGRVDRRGSMSRAGWFLVLLIAIGPGLIVNLGFKQNWGRPRPHEIQEFGGTYAFTPVGSPGTVTKGNSSFPSGHAAIAFYMMAPGFLASANRPRWSMILFAGGILYGLGMGATRVVQGGHFTSDVLWAGGIVYLAGAVLARGLLRETPRPQ